MLLLYHEHAHIHNYTLQTMHHAYMIKFKMKKKKEKTIYDWFELSINYTWIALQWVNSTTYIHTTIYLHTYIQTKFENKEKKRSGFAVHDFNMPSCHSNTSSTSMSFIAVHDFYIHTLTHPASRNTLTSSKYEKWENWNWITASHEFFIAI